VSNQNPSQTEDNSAETAAADQPAAAPAGPAPAQAARAALKQFQEQYAVFRECKPLAIGIDKQLMERVPGLTRRVLRMALGIHTSSLRYLKAMEKATVRYDLDDQVREDVTDEHRKHASQTLRERFKKNAEQKRTQQAAAKAEQDAAEAAQRRADKLNQLTAKFSKR
jgi:ProP effector